MDANPATRVRILGVNAVGAESENGLMTLGRDLPWLQDVPAQDVWTLWDVEYRDVVILDGLNRPVGVFNLTVHDLAIPAEYAALRQMLLDAAGE